MAKQILTKFVTADYMKRNQSIKFWFNCTSHKAKTYSFNVIKTGAIPGGQMWLFIAEKRVQSQATYIKAHGGQSVTVGGFFLSSSVSPRQSSPHHTSTPTCHRPTRYATALT
jgi:hypothetical protein